MKRMNVSKLTLAAWPPSQSLHLRRHTTPGSQAPSLSLSYCWAEAQQHQVTAGPVVQTTGGTPTACQYLSRGTQLALRDALDLILGEVHFEIPEILAVPSLPRCEILLGRDVIFGVLCDEIVDLRHSACGHNYGVAKKLPN